MPNYIPREVTETGASCKKAYMALVHHCTILFRIFSIGCIRVWRALGFRVLIFLNLQTIFEMWKDLFGKCKVCKCLELVSEFLKLQLYQTKKGFPEIGMLILEIGSDLF